MMDNNKNPTQMGHPPMPLHPFALASKNLVGDVWFNLASDKVMYNNLKKAALNWVHKRKFFHHDLNEFSWLEHSQRQVRRTQFDDGLVNMSFSDPLCTQLIMDQVYFTSYSTCNRRINF